MINSCHFVLNVTQLYLCGLPGKKLEKLRRLVSAAGGLRLSHLSEELTHVVMGELDRDINRFLSNSTHRSELLLVNCCHIHAGNFIVVSE